MEINNVLEGIPQHESQPPGRDDDPGLVFGDGLRQGLNRGLVEKTLPHLWWRVGRNHIESANVAGTVEDDDLVEVQQDDGAGAHF